MPTFLTELLSQLKAIWSKLDGGQRMTIGAVGIGAAVFLVGVVIYSSQPDYVHLITYKNRAELAEMTEALGNLDYKADNSSISISNAQKKQGLQALADSDLLPKENDENSLISMASGMTERKAQAWRRLQTDAAKAIMKIKGVRDAGVSSREVKRSPWASKEGDARSRATVTIRLLREEGWRQTARAAIQIVTAKLGIREADVTVINAVTSQIVRADDAGTPGSGDFYKQQDRLGQDFGLRAQMLLDEAYPGLTSVRVSVVLIPEWSTTTMPVAMENQLLLEKDSTKDQTTSTGPGGDPSISEKTQPGGSGLARPGQFKGSSPKREKNTKSEKYSDKTGIRRSGQMAAKMERMSVALMLDHSIFKDKDGKDLVNAPKVEDIEDLVKGAIGWNDDRDGKAIQTLMVNIKALPDDLGGSTESGPGMMAKAEGYLEAIGPYVALGLIIFFLKGLLKKAELKPVGSTSENLVEEIPEEDLTPDEQTKRMRKEIEKAIGDDPATVSRMIETWLSEQPA